MVDTVNDPNAEDKETEVGASVLLDAKPLPAPKPAAPAVAEPKPTELPEGSVVEYEATGDVGLGMALQFVGKAGIHGDHPAMVAAAQGDFSILKATLATKGTPGWEQFVALGEAAFARSQEANKAKDTALVNLVHEAAGGAKEWAAIQEWASANATPEEKAQINAQLNGGTIAAKAAVLYLTNLYSRANNVVVEPKDPAARATRNGGVPDASTGPLSAKDYAEAVQALNIKLKGRLDGSPEYASLQRRRQAAMR